MKSPWQTNVARGFTLVELLVVIGIIALLISILLPALSRARLSSQSVACMSNLRQHGMALRMYANDNSGWLMYADEYGTKLGMYFGQKNEEKAKWEWLRYYGHDRPIQHCPMPEYRDGYPLYGVNYVTVFSLEEWYYAYPGAGKSRKLSKVPNSTFLVADVNGLTYIFPPYRFTMTIDFDKDGKADSYNFPGIFAPWGDYLRYNGLAPRHPNKKANFLFPDGSVRPFTLREFCANKDQIWGRPDRP